VTALTPIATDPDLPAGVRDLIGVPRYRLRADITVEAASIQLGCSAVRNGNPLHWNPAGATPGRVVAPASMLSTWTRPHYWAPGGHDLPQALQLHFDLKAALGLPEAVVTDDLLVLGRPIRAGDRVESFQTVVAIGPVKTTRIGVGRFWDIDVRYDSVDGDHLGTETFRHFGYRRG
jgi:hypothetical protein